MIEDMSRAVRALLRGLDRAALATALPALEGGAAWPYASLVLVAVDHDLTPILLLSDLAEHSKAIAAESRVSLLFDGTGGLDQPLSGARVTLLGRIEQTIDPRLARRFLARHPDAEMYASFKDFHFYKVAPERAHLVAGFGRIHWFGADALLYPPAAALCESEPGIIEHMNTDHADAVQLYATRLLGRDGDGWTMTGIDPEGADLRRGGVVLRLPFAKAVTTAEEARVELVRLVKQVRSA